MGDPPKAGHDERCVNNLIEADQRLAFRWALENAWDVFMGAGDDVGGADFSDEFSGCTTRINGGFDSAYVTFDDDIMARLIKKTLFVGVFAYLISNWNYLAQIVFESFAGIGLKASGTGFSTADLLRPGKVAQTGLDAGRPLLESISDLMGYWSFFETFI
jgi:hypothetical protein